jgi:hypothetical protein
MIEQSRNRIVEIGLRLSFLVEKYRQEECDPPRDFEVDIAGASAASALAAASAASPLLDRLHDRGRAGRGRCP